MKGLFQFTALTLIGLAALLAVLYFSGSSGRPAVFANTPSLNDAMFEAERAGKPVLVFATADWCGPCKKLKSGPLKDRQLAQAIEQRTVPVYLDLTQPGPNERATAESLGVQGIPALILLRGGSVVSRTSGYQSAESLRRWIESNT